MPTTTKSLSRSGSMEIPTNLSLHRRLKTLEIAMVRNPSITPMTRQSKPLAYFAVGRDTRRRISRTICYSPIGLRLLFATKTHLSTSASSCTSSCHHHLRVNLRRPCLLRRFPQTILRLLHQCRQTIIHFLYPRFQTIPFILSLCLLHILHPLLFRQAVYFTTHPRITQTWSCQTQIDRSFHPNASFVRYPRASILILGYIVLGIRN